MLDDYKFDRHLGSGAAQVPVEFHSYWESLNRDRVALRPDKILR